jgi:hypothetical protein
VGYSGLNWRMHVAKLTSKHIFPLYKTKWGVCLKFEVISGYFFLPVLFWIKIFLTKCFSWSCELGG